ncbi:hypothetical protein ACOBV8_19640 (plasmid) [Pseudoalteromonas espejiana]
MGLELPLPSIAHYNHAKHTLVISQEVADALNLSQGDAARFFRL